MSDDTWINKEAGWGVLPQLIPGQYGWIPHYRESYNIPDKEWDADSDAIYRESLPATFNYRTWESAKAPAVTHQPQAVTANNTVADPVAEYRTYIQNGTINPVVYRAKGDTGNPEHDAYYTQAGGKIVSDDDIVNGIIRGEYGNGDKRKQALMALGLTAEDIERIRGLVNARMYAAQARPAKRRKPAAVPAKPTFRPQERVLYQGMPMTSVGQHDPEYIYVR